MMLRPLSLVFLVSLLACSSGAEDAEAEGGEAREGVNASFPTGVFETQAGPRSALLIQSVGGELRASARIALEDGVALSSTGSSALRLAGDVATATNGLCNWEIRRASATGKVRFSGTCERARGSVAFDSVLSERADDVFRGRWHGEENDPIVDVAASNDEGVTLEVSGRGRVLAPQRRHAWTTLDAVEIKGVLDLGDMRRCEITLTFDAEQRKVHAHFAGFGCGFSAPTVTLGSD